MFEEFKPNWYTAKTVVLNEFLNEKLANDTYGIYYSVMFDGDAETFLWQSKTPPIEGEKYYGHVEKSKSGKSMRFKKDKVPDNELIPEGANPKQASYVESPEKQASINKAVALNNAVLNSPMGEVAEVLAIAEAFYDWLSGRPDELDKPITDLMGEDDGAE